MNKKQIITYVEMRRMELQMCLERPLVYNEVACKARLDELTNLLKVMGTDN